MRRSVALVLFAFPAIFPVGVIAQDGQPKTIEDLERDQFLLGGTLWERVEKASKEKAIQCMKAFPHERFCGCLSEQIPMVITVAQYAAIVATPREQLDSSASSEDERKLIEVTFAAREKCSKVLFPQ